MNKSCAIEFLQRVAAGEVQRAFDDAVAPGFRHHNPFFRGDAGSLRHAMQENAVAMPHKTLEVQRAVEEGDWVVVHSRMRPSPQAPAMALVHIFRFGGGRIEELWDIGQPEPAASPNEYGMF